MSVSEARGVSSPRKTSLAVAQHGGWYQDARRRGFTQIPVQLLNLSLLIGLQHVHIHQVPDEGEGRDFSLECF